MRKDSIFGGIKTDKQTAKYAKGAKPHADHPRTPAPHPRIKPRKYTEGHGKGRLRYAPLSNLGEGVKGWGDWLKETGTSTSLSDLGGGIKLSATLRIPLSDLNRGGRIWR